MGRAAAPLNSLNNMKTNSKNKFWESIKGSIEHDGLRNAISKLVAKGATLLDIEELCPGDKMHIVTFDGKLSRKQVNQFFNEFYSWWGSNRSITDRSGDNDGADYAAYDDCTEIYAYCE